jgi:hypothetical protein
MSELANATMSALDVTANRTDSLFAPLLNRTAAAVPNVSAINASSIGAGLNSALSVSKAPVTPPTNPS